MVHVTPESALAPPGVERGVLKVAEARVQEPLEGVDPRTRVATETVATLRERRRADQRQHAEARSEVADAAGRQEIAVELPGARFEDGRFHAGQAQVERV